MELGDLVGRIASYPDPLAVFAKPFHLAGNKPFFDVSFDIRVYHKGNAFFILLYKDIIEVVLDIVQQQDSRAYGAGAVAGRANFAGHDIHFGAYPLACDLNQAELARR